MQFYQWFDAVMVQPLLPREAAHKLALATTGCCQSQWWMLLICLWPQLDAAKAAFPGVWPPVDAPSGCCQSVTSEDCTTTE